jgi:threonine dehydrogenase-like Zn-dependent dehydrogenase
VLPEKRLVAALDGAGRVSVIEEPVPELRPGSVLVEVESSLISPGTELGGVPARRRDPDPEKPPRRFGYGNAGVVLAVGRDCPRIEPGQRLACMGAGYALHATHAVVPRNLTVPVPEGLSPDLAAFGHLAATALWAVRRARVEFGAHLAVFGLGIIGQVAAQVARASGAHVMAVDGLEFRREIARRCGADLVADPQDAALERLAAGFTRGYGLDAAILAFGGEKTAALEVAGRMMKLAPDGHRYGRISIVGGGEFRADFPQQFGNIDICASSRPGPGYHDEAWEFGRDYPPVFVEWTTRRNMEECLLFAARGRLDLGALVTHRFPLAEAPAACEELIAHPERALGVVLRP